MKEEIKEICKEDDELVVYYKDNSTRTFDTLTIDVLDFITNLQQENEKLKEIQCAFLGTGCKKQLEYYKSRCEKAIRYLKKREYDNSDCSVCSFMSDDLLNILQGSDENV